MLSMSDNIENRRAILERRLLTHTLYLLERELISDGGGTRVEKFIYKGRNFKGRPQPIFRRPDGTNDDAIIAFGDIRIVYPYRETISQVDRIQINNRVYTIRNIYDNVDDAMTNQCYAAVISGSFVNPPILNQNATTQATT